MAKTKTKRREIVSFFSLHSWGESKQKSVNQTAKKRIPETEKCQCIPYGRRQFLSGAYASGNSIDTRYPSCHACQHPRESRFRAAAFAELVAQCSPCTERRLVSKFFVGGMFRWHRPAFIHRFCTVCSSQVTTRVAENA